MNQLAAVLAVLTIPAAGALAQIGPKAAGHWEGKLQTPDGELPFTLDNCPNRQGSLDRLNKHTGQHVDRRSDY